MSSNRKPSLPGILEVIANWPEGKNFRPSEEEKEEEEGKMIRAEEAPPYNQLPGNEKRYTLRTDGSCHVIGIR